MVKPSSPTSWHSWSGTPKHSVLQATETLMACVALCERQQGERKMESLPIYKQDGTLTRGDQERELRWQVLPLPPLFWVFANVKQSFFHVTSFPTMIAVPFKYLLCFLLALCLTCLSCPVPCHHHLCLPDQSCHGWDNLLPNDLAVHTCVRPLTAH